jgi:hypothetical protein
MARLAGRRVAKCSAPAYYGSSLGSNPDVSQKYKMGDISEGVANTRLKNKQKKLCSEGATSRNNCFVEDQEITLRLS